MYIDFGLITIYTSLVAIFTLELFAEAVGMGHLPSNKSKQQENDVPVVKIADTIFRLNEISQT
jgi:hypothetical protein